MNTACIIIAGGKRERLLDEQIVPSVLQAGFTEVLVVGDYHSFSGGRYLAVPALTRTTTDALVKRDVGTLASSADWLFYVCDDHAVRQVGTVPSHWLEIGVPNRYCVADGIRIPLNMGLLPADPNAPYVGGHAGLFSRKLIQLFPWTTQPHDRCWDLLSSRAFQSFGASIRHRPDWVVEDLEPEATPWQ